MALLIDIRQDAWMTDGALAERLKPYLPGVRIFLGSERDPLDDVIMVACSRLHADLADRLPNLRLVQKLGAGVETMIGAAGFPPGVRIARLTANGAAAEIAEYCLAYVLEVQRNMPAHRNDAVEGRWRQRAPRPSRDTTIAVLGLGHIGGRTARLFAQLGFRVLGWSRSRKTIDNVDCRHGPDELPAVLAQADHVCAILPSTPETRDMFDVALLARMKPGAQLINCGRGDLIVDADLLAALDSGTPGRAVLDVFRTEPLPDDHPFWRHPRVTVTPHVSGWSVDDALMDVAENYLRLVDGRPLLNEVDLQNGY